MQKVITITGCAGFIGYYVAKACLDKGWYVRGIDIETYASNLSSIQKLMQYPRFVYEKTNINNLTLIYDCDYIINCAAETHVDNSIVENSSFMHSNVNGVHRLLSLIQQKHRFKMPILLHFSTDEVYGDIVDGSHTEEDLLKPSNPYSATKAAADMLITAWNRTFNTPYIIVRPTNNYGIGQYVEKFIPKTIKYLTLGRKVPLHENGTPVRTWLHVEDTADAIIHIIGLGITDEIYNISGNYEDQNINIFKKIVNLHNITDDYNQFADFSVKRQGQDVRYSIDDSKLRATGWSPHRQFDEKLADIVSFHSRYFAW